MENIIKKAGKNGENRLRLWCNSLSPKISLVLIIGMLAVFAVMSVYMAVSSAYDSCSRHPDIQHIRGIQIKSGNDSINIQKIKEYDHFDE